MPAPDPVTRFRFLIIDGYNLLHSYGFSARRGQGSLEPARQSLIRFLAACLPESMRRHTTVVFDSHQAGLPTQSAEYDLLIEFASQHASADDRIIQLIRQHSAARQLLVVSSDHRIQRAAAARRAGFIDSDRWLELMADSPAIPSDSGPPATTEGQPDEQIDVKYWLQQFEISGLEPDNGIDQPGPAGPAAGKPDLPAERDGLQIFPPGYADDLFEEGEETGR